MTKKEETANSKTPTSRNLFKKPVIFEIQLFIISPLLNPSNLPIQQTIPPILSNVRLGERYSLISKIGILLTLLFFTYTNSKWQ